MARLDAVFTARDRLSNPIGTMAKNTKGLTKLFKRLALAGGLAFSAKGIVEFGKQALISFGNFEKGMNEVFTLLPGISQKAMDALSTQVKQFSKEFGALPEKVVPALYQALSAGVPKDNVFEFLEVANKAAVGGITSLETAVDGISSVVNSYGSEVISAAEASDLMFTTVRLGKTDFQQLSKSLFNVLPSANSAGVAFTDVSAGIARLTAQGTPTSVATTQMRSALDELSKSGTKTSKIFERASGTTFKQFIASGGNLQEALAIMNKEADRLGLGIKDLFSSVEAGGAAFGLSGKNAAKFVEALEEMEQSAGATEDAYAIMDKGIVRSFERIIANGKVTAIEIGDKLAPKFEEFAQTVIDKMPEAANTFLSAMDWVGASIKEIVPEFIEIKDLLLSIANKVFPSVGFESKAFKDIVVELVDAGLNRLIEALKFVNDNIIIVQTVLGLLTAAYVINLIAVSAVTVATWYSNAAMLAAAIASGAETSAIVALYAAQYIAAGAAGIMTGAQWLLNAALTANPIGIVIVLIGLLIGAIVLAYQRSETFRKILSFLWDSLKQGSKAAVGFLIGKFEGLINIVNKAIDLINMIPGVDIPDIQLPEGIKAFQESQNSNAFNSGENVGGSVIANEPTLDSSDITPSSIGSDSQQQLIDNLLGGNNGSNTTQDNRQYNISLDSQQIAQESDPEAFKQKVLSVVDESLKGEIDNGGGLEVDF